MQITDNIMPTSSMYATILYMSVLFCSKEKFNL